jgi:hypothetical protein
MPASVDERIAKLSPAKQALLARIRARQQSSRHPISSTQFGIWLFEQLHPGSSAYHNPAALLLHGRLDVLALQNALADVQDHHPALRTCFEEDEDGVPQQVVAARPPPAFRVLGADDVDLALSKVAQHAAAPFDLRAGPIWRTLVVRLPDQRSVIALTMHHIVSDGWSLGIVLSDLQSAYQARCAGQEPRLPDAGASLGAFMAMEQAKLVHESRARLTRYWSNTLAGCSREVGLPHTGHPRTPEPSTTPVCIADRDRATLCRLSQRNRASLFGGMLALYAIVIGAWSRETDIVITTPVAGRTDPASHRIVGCLLNTVPVRVCIDRNSRFQDLIRGCGQQLRAAIANSALPFSEISGIANAQTRSSTPLGNVMLVHNNAGRPRTFGGAAASVVEIPVGGVKVDWALHLEVSPNRIAGQFEYPVRRFNRDIMTAVAASLQAAAGRLSDDPETTTGALLDAIAVLRDAATSASHATA